MTPVFTTYKLCSAVPWKHALLCLYICFTCTKKYLCISEEPVLVSCMNATENSVATYAVSAICCTQFPFCSFQCFWNQLKSKHPGRKVQFLHPWFQLFLNLMHKHSFLRYVSEVPNKELMIFSNTCGWNLRPVCCQDTVFGMEHWHKKISHCSENNFKKNYPAKRKM